MNIAQLYWLVSASYLVVAIVYAALAYAHT
jgi:hypothetical protein